MSVSFWVVVSVSLAGGVGESRGECRLRQRRTSEQQTPKLQREGHPRDKQRQTAVRNRSAEQIAPKRKEKQCRTANSRTPEKQAAPGEAPPRQSVEVRFPLGSLACVPAGRASKQPRPQRERHPRGIRT